MNTENTSPLFQCTDVSARYGRINVCRNISLTVQRGEILTVLGPNGAGKSSFLGSISGVVSGKGRITLEGEDISTLAAEKRAQKGLRLVPDGRGLFPGLTVRENLNLGSRLAPSDQRERLTERALELFPILQSRMDQLAGDMSGGEQQMLAVGKAIAGAPKILMLDEPTQGIAPGVFDVLRQALLALREENMGIILVEQRHAFAESVADRSVVLVGGTIVYESAPRVSIERDHLMQIYTEAGASV